MTNSSDGRIVARLDPTGEIQKLPLNLENTEVTVEVEGEGAHGSVEDPALGDAAMLAGLWHSVGKKIHKLVKKPGYGARRYKKTRKSRKSKRSRKSKSSRKSKRSRKSKKKTKRRRY